MSMDLTTRALRLVDLSLNDINTKYLFIYLLSQYDLS